MRLFTRSRSGFRLFLKKTLCPLASRISYAVWFVGMYFSLVGDQLMPQGTSSRFLQEAQGLTQRFLALFVVLALWPWSLGVPRDFVTDRKRRQFLAVLSLLALPSLILEAIERKVSPLIIGCSAFLFLAAAAVLGFRRVGKGTSWPLGRDGAL